MSQLETARPSVGALRERISEEVVRVISGEYGRALLAVILTGSWARDEATVLWEGENGRVLGDAEFYLVFREGQPVPPDSALAPLARRIELGIERERLTCRIGLSPVSPGFLRGLPRHIAPFELKTCGKVVWGDPKVLGMIPEFSAADIEREDAWRLLNNRIIEQLEAWVDPTATGAIAMPYRTVKLYLDLAASYLVFAGAFEAGYGPRAGRLRRLAEDGTGASPFPLGEFAEHVRAATESKLAGQPTTPDFAKLNGQVLQRAAPGYARRLWRWELQQLTGCRREISDRELMRCWMDTQPFRRRVRGWAYVLRACGWHHSIGHWPHWIKLAGRASPRSWVYAAAAELFFALSPDDSGTAAFPSVRDPHWDEIRSWLPVVPTQQERAADEQRLASEIAWNYHHFLEFTRS